MGKTFFIINLIFLVSLYSLYWGQGENHGRSVGVHARWQNGEPTDEKTDLIFELLHQILNLAKKAKKHSVSM